jgi:hypothetical protein
MHDLYLITDDLDMEIGALRKAGVKCDEVSQQRWGRSTRISLPERDLWVFTNLAMQGRNDSPVNGRFWPVSRLPLYRPKADVRRLTSIQVQRASRRLLEGTHSLGVPMLHRRVGCTRG